jgi:hypothetical protein
MKARGAPVEDVMTKTMVTVIVKITIECESASDAFAAVDGALDEGSFQDEIDEYFTDHDANGYVVSTLSEAP